MTTGEALRVVAMLTAYFRQELSTETAALWAQELLPERVEDGFAAARALGTTQRFMPSLADFRAQIIDCRKERELREAMALPPGEEAVMTWPEFLEEHPEVRQRITGWLREAVDEEAPS